MIDDYTTTFSHSITYTFLFKGWENEIFELGSERVKGGVTLVNLQRQLATPIRNACFSHEFADMIHFWIAFKNFQRVAALQISQKIVRNGVLHWNDFSRNIVSLQVDQCNITLKLANEEHWRTWSGSAFHNLGATDWNDRSPACLVRADGWCRKFCEEDRSSRLGVYRCKRLVMYSGASPFKALQVSSSISSIGCVV